MLNQKQLVEVKCDACSTQEVLSIKDTYEFHDKAKKALEGWANIAENTLHIYGLNDGGGSIFLCPICLKSLKRIITHV